MKKLDSINHNGNLNNSYNNRGNIDGFTNAEINSGFDYLNQNGINFNSSSFLNGNFGKPIKDLFDTNIKS